MTEQQVNSSPTGWYGLIIATIAIVSLSTLLDIPFLRQVTGFIFLTFVPGYLLLLIMKLNKLGIAERIVLTVGLSTAFILFLGLAVNSLLVAIGYMRPLSTVSLLISFSAVISVLAIIARIRNEDISLHFSVPKFTTREKALLVVPALFPFLSIAGVRVMNLTDNNLLIMSLLLLIPAYIIFISFYQQKIPQRIYPSLIYAISISLLLIVSLRSNHLIGADIHQWYGDFNKVIEEMRWTASELSLTSSSLIISIVPAVYQAFINIEPELLYKILFPLLFSVSPLVIYIISRKYISDYYAFIASLFFMAQFTFLWASATSNSSIAIGFFALFVMTQFHKDMDAFQKNLLLIIFISSSILSHYGTSYIFFFVIALTWLGLKILPLLLHITGRKVSQDTSPGVTQPKPKEGISVTIVILFFVALFLWYSQLTGAPFSAAVSVIIRSLVGINQLFILDAKGPTVASAFGQGIATAPQILRVIFSWISVAFIAIGVFGVLIRYRVMTTILTSDKMKPSYLKSKFESEYVVMAIACTAILAIAVILPFILSSYSIERAFHQMLILLSTFFVLGGITIANLLRTKSHWVLLTVLIAFFMSTSGMMYQLQGYPATIYLNSEGPEYRRFYIQDRDHYAAKWIGKFSREGTQIYTGTGVSSRMLLSQGNIPVARTRLDFVTQYEHGLPYDSYMFLTYANIVTDEMYTKYPEIFTGKNKLYTNGGSEIYR